MTYGENGGIIRTELTSLLHQQRLQYRLSDDPRRFANRDHEQREAYGAQIRRYRQSILTWCYQATIAADPYLGANEFFDHHHKRGDGPFDHFRNNLDRVLEASTAPRATTDEVSTPNDIDLVETWRRMGAAAARGEHDFHAGLGHGLLNAAQCHTVMRDVAAIVQGLIILDHRYASTPGWEKLRNGGWLGWNALAAGLEASIDPPDYTVDHRGWRPPLRFVRGPARPGLLGVLQAEQNLLVRLTDAIAPINLRLVAAAQSAVSADLARRTTDTDLYSRWSTRAETHELLRRSLRNIGSGHATHGSAAAREATNAINRIATLSGDARPDDKMLAAFDKRFIAIDARITTLIEDGVRNNTILRRIQLPRIDTDAPSLVKPVRERLAPIERPEDSDLLKLAGTRLHPAPESLEPPPDAAHGRADLLSAIVANTPASLGGAIYGGRGPSL